MDGIIDVGLKFRIENEIDFRIRIKFFEVEKQFGHGGAEGVELFFRPVIPFVFADWGVGPAVVRAAADENERRITEAIGARHKAEATEVFCVIACIANG